MATAEEGGTTANTTSSSYGGGGAGGKFRKKPFRRQTTPYDRPSTALRGNNDNNSSWLKKLVVVPASKLISFGAGRFFASLLHKRLSSPPPPQPPVCDLFMVSRNMYLLMLAEAEVGVTEGGQETVLNSQDGAHEPSGGGYSQPMNMSSSNGISELEHLLKQRTFTRSEVVHLRELLQSRAVELSFGDVSQINEDNALDFARHQQFASGHVEENRNGGNRSSALMSTPIVNSKVLEDDNASPAELAKAYMGTRPSKVSPSMLGIRSRLGREDLLGSLPSASGSPIMALTKKTPGIMAAPDNGFITPRFRGRSAIYNMARTPYSKVHLTSSLKGSGSNGYAGHSMSSSFLSESDEKLGSRPVSSKRRSSVLDDEVGSIGSIRRIRQKSNLLASRLQPTTHEVGVGSHAKQKLQLIGEPSHKFSKDVGENENESVPSTSYGHVPSKSNEVAAKILQHLEKMTPKERSSESKLVARRDKSPLKLIPSMLSGQALRSMKDVDSSKLMLELQDDHKLGDRSNATLDEARDFSMQKQEKIEENGPKQSVPPLDKWSPVANIDSVVSSKASMPSSSATDSISKTGASQPPQKKRTFRMSAKEDYFDQDDDAHCNGLASRPFSGKQGPTESSLTDTSKVALSEEPRVVKPSIQPVDQSPLDIISAKTNEPNSGAVTLGEVSSVFSLQVSEGTMVAPQSAVLPLSVAAFDKSKEENNHPLFAFNSKVVKNVASLPSDSSKGTEFKLESSSSFVNASASIGSKTKVPQSEESSHLNLFKAGDVNGKSVSVPSAASSGPSLSSGHPLVSFSAASSYDTNQISKGSAFPVPTSTGTSTPATSSDSMFGLEAAKPSSLGGFQFGFPVVNPATSVSAASTTSVSEAAVGSKAEMVPNSGSSTSSLVSVGAFAATSSASNNTCGISSSVGFVAPNTLQGSLFANATKPVGFGLQDNSTQPVSADAVLPAFNISSNTTSFGSSSSSQVSNPSTSFAFNHPAISEDKNVFKFGATATEGSAVRSSSGATTGIFGSSNAPLFSSFATAPGSAPLTTTASSLTSSSAFTTAIAGSSSVSRNSLASSSSSAPSISVFGSSWQSPNPSPAFGSSTFTAPSHSTGSLFSPVSSAPTTSVCNPPSSNPIFPFTTPSPSFLSSPSAFVGQHGFGASAYPDQMNAEDSMSEDPVQQQHQLSAVSPMFGQPVPSSTFPFGLQQPGPFMFAGQQNQIAPPQNPSPFQASGSLEFSAGGNFSLGSGGGEKSGRKIVKISRSKNRKK
ncbi:hypothetical protein OROMI_001247 [Orobanche minor]